MVRIKTITISGFKSFSGKRTVIKLPPGLIVITGPNGGGKSTLLDAVRFALGELSAHNLRAERFPKLLHESRDGQDKHAIVSLTLDNSGRTIPIDAEEVVLTRKLSSTGESEYIVNGRNVSRNEMLTLLSAANIRPDGLNLVAQGSVIGIAEMSGKELRQVLEEAAGISGYKKKRDEALKELEKAQKNIDIAKAATSEVRNRVKQLELERNQYLRKILVEREVNRLKSISLLNELKNIQQSLLLLEARASEVANNIEEKNAKITEISGRISNVRKEIDGLQQLREQIIKKTLMVEKQIYEKESEKNRVEAEIRSYEDSIEELTVKRILMAERIHSWKSRLSELEAKMREKAVESEKAYQAYKTAEEKLTALRNSSEELRRRLEELEEIYSSKLDEIRYLKLSDDGRSLLLENTEKQIIKAKQEREEILKQLNELQEKSKELAENLKECNYAIVEASAAVYNMEQKIKVEKETITALNLKIEEVNKVIDEIKLLKTTIINLIEKVRKDKRGHGKEAAETLGEYLGDSLSPAFKAVLGDWVNALLVDDLENAIQLAVKSAELGIPLKIIPTSHLRLDMEGLIESITCTSPPQILESARDLRPGDRNVTTNDGIYIGPNYTINVVGDYENRQLASWVEKNLVKLDSLEQALLKARELLESKIAVYEGSVKQLTAKLEGAKKLIEERRFESARLETNIQNILKSIDDLKGKLSLVEKNLASLEAERDRLVVAEKVSERASLSGLKAEIEKLREEVRHVEENIRQQSFTISNLYKMYLNVEREKDAINIEYKSLADSIENAEKEAAYISDLLEKLNIKVEHGKREVGRLEEELISLRRLKDEAEVERAAVEQELVERTKVLEELEGLLQRLREEVGALERENNSIMVERVRLETNIQSINERLQMLSATQEDSSTPLPAELLQPLEEELRSLSIVNQLAIIQYEGIIPNYKLRATRINELEMERRRILDFIDSINREEMEAFGKALEKVSNSFNFYFNQLTGGEGFLRLEDPQAPLNSGVEMVVKFVGKQARSASYMSGGEKSVSAVALILALQDLTPAQFYIFDEIDAHLDVVYAKNLVNLLKKMSTKKQIIIITLKDIIAEQADALFGVYMVNGASRVIKTELAKVVGDG